jgi:hypothetical protein
MPPQLAGASFSGFFRLLKIARELSAGPAVE